MVPNKKKRIGQKKEQKQSMKKQTFEELLENSSNFNLVLNE